MSKTSFPKTQIKIGKKIKGHNTFTSYEFTHKFAPALDNNLKKESGVINLPNKERKYPVVVMIRGYVDPNIYTMGEETQHAGEFFAQNGFITIAPDFLGYGNSDKEAKNVFESRFQTYTTILSLLNSLPTIKEFYQKNILLWGHSNGGQIALTILAITGKDYPTTLWAPVSKPFPYSILYYTDNSDDGGKFLQRELSKFEEIYDPDLYSVSKYFDKIKAKIQLHQGTADNAVPVSWSNNLTKTLKDLNIRITYYTYLGADHNLTPSWDLVVSRDLQFFKNNLQ